MGILTQRPASTLPDLTHCEREPIHLAGAVEPNGVVLVAGDQTGTFVQVSANALPMLGQAPEALLGKPLQSLFSEESITRIIPSGIIPSGENGKRSYISDLKVLGKETAFDALVHRQPGLLVMELEPSCAEPIAGSPAPFATLTYALDEMVGHLSLTALCERIARRIRLVTGFDRVMIYRFLKDDSGSVIAEDRRDDLTPFLGLRYPASDIPAQARRLYLINSLRLKADVNAATAAIVPALNPVTGAALDMTFCVLRAMSPVHVEYLRNMGVAASMSISIVKDERLWGLIACHHTTAKIVPHKIRITCEVLARAFSSHIAAAEERDDRAGSAALKSLLERVSMQLRAGGQAVETLAGMAEEISQLLGAFGFALSIGGAIVLSGTTPSREQTEALFGWLAANQQEQVLATERLSEIYPLANEFEPQISGLLSIRIAFGGSDFLAWLRPPVVQVVNWGGNPEKPVEETNDGQRINPRRSFELWKQTVRDCAAPWTDADRLFASSLRPLIAEALYFQANQQVVRLNTELARSNEELDAFAYSASHDLLQPVRSIRIYAQLLARQAGANLPDDVRANVDKMERSAARMGTLIDSLLSYSQIGGSERRKKEQVALDSVLQSVLMNLDQQIRESGADIKHDPLPTVLGDPDTLMQLLQNLISNAIKYRQPGLAPRIFISAVNEQGFTLVSVKDEGQGFDAQYSDVIFMPFKRLHGEDVPGHGIGLHICKRIVALHNGRIWAESGGTNRGATFRFTLPLAETKSIAS